MSFGFSISCNSYSHISLWLLEELPRSALFCLLPSGRGVKGVSEHFKPRCLGWSANATCDNGKVKRIFKLIGPWKIWIWTKHLFFDAQTFVVIWRFSWNFGPNVTHVTCFSRSKNKVNNVHFSHMFSILNRPKHPQTAGKSVGDLRSRNADEAVHPPFRRDGNLRVSPHDAKNPWKSTSSLSMVGRRFGFLLGFGNFQGRTVTVKLREGNNLLIRPCFLGGGD